MANAYNAMRLRLITPSRVLFDEDVDMVIFRSGEGDMGIMYGHEPMTTIMGYGQMRIFRGDEESIYSVLGGFAEVDANCLTVLSDAAERPDEINLERAQRAKDRALRKLRERGNEIDIKRAELALRRAHVRIEVSTYPIIRDRKGD